MKTFTCAAALALATTACATQPSAPFESAGFVGCYTTGTAWEAGGNELGVRVVRDGERFLMYTTRYDTRADWVDREPLSAGNRSELREATPDELANEASDDADRPQAGLVSPDGPMALYKVRKGARYGGEAVGSDYLLFVLFFTRELSRTSCD